MKIVNFAFLVLMIGMIETGQSMDQRPKSIIHHTGFVPLYTPSRSEYGYDNTAFLVGTMRSKRVYFKKSIFEIGKEYPDHLFLLKHQPYLQEITLEINSLAKGAYPPKIRRPLAHVNVLKKCGLHPKKLNLFPVEHKEKAFGYNGLYLLLSNAWLKHLNSLTYRPGRIPLKEDNSIDHVGRSKAGPVEKEPLQFKFFLLPQRSNVLLERLHTLNTMIGPRKSSNLLPLRMSCLQKLTL